MKSAKPYSGYSRLYKCRGVMLLPITILLISLSLTYAQWHSTTQESNQLLRNAFDFDVHEAISGIKHRMDAYEQVLRGARGLFAASERVERSEFKAYIETLQLQQKYPGIQGLGFSLIIPKSEENQHIAKIRKQGFPAYKLRRESEQEFYTSIIYLEPFKDRNLRAFGYDMYSEPVRRSAMQQARDSNHAAISGKVKLLQEIHIDVQAGFLMYLPVYKNNLPYNTQAERQANIIGWVYEPFRMNDFMEGLSVSLLKQINIEIYDGGFVNPATKMFDSDSSASCDIHKSKLQRMEQIEMAGHLWTMAACSTPAFESKIDNQKSQIIAIAGSFLSLLLTVIVWQLLTSRSRALTLATKMTHELSESEARFRMMADSAPVLIWVAGLDKLCFWFNKVWLEFTGRTLDQELGNGWAEGLHPEDFQRCLDCYVSHFDRHQPFVMEYRLKRHDGEYRWILDSGVPRFDSEGVFSGFIGSCIDITERKRIEAALLRSNADLTRFAEVSAHHLMEPIRRLLSYSQRLVQLLTPSLSALQKTASQEIEACLEYLQINAGRLHAMVRDIQLYLEAAEPRQQMQLEDVNSIVQQIQKRLLLKLNSSKTCIVAEHLPPVFLDRPRLLDLFSLLIENALNHGQPATPDQRAQISITGERAGNLSRYTVTDYGGGIPTEYHERVFEIFERLGHNEAAGSGIGLAIARRIVESRHGKIWVENPAHPGTTVVFELPDGE